MSKKDRVGEVFVSNEGCEMVIVEYNGANDIWIEFQDKHKARKNVTYDQCRGGKVKNPYHPSVYGAGYLGLMSDGSKPKTKVNGKTTREYKVWYNMVMRVYDPKFHETHPTYKGVILEDCLHCFAYFLEHIHLIDGYEEVWLKSDIGDRVALDKDIKQQGVENKIYSLDTIMFVSASENCKEMLERCGNPSDVQGMKIYGINVKTGEKTKVFNSSREASGELGIAYQNISVCLNGKRKTAGGYKWFKVK